MKKLLASLLTIVLMLSVFTVPSMAEDMPIATVPATGDVLSDYYVNETYYFRYRIGSFRNGLNEGRPYREGPDYENDNLLSDKALIIYGFSEGFSGLEEFVVPDEINGEKIENVIIKDYQPLKRVVLSDGIQKFACYMDSEEDGEWEIPREENPIESVHLGKDFLLDSLSYLKTTQGRLENLESVTISEENPYLNMHDGAVYSEDYETFVYCPPRLDTKTFTLKSGTKVISEGAFANSRYIQNIKRIEKVERIGAQAFRGTKKIKKITLGEKIKEIPVMAFYNSSVERVTLGENVETIGSYAFENSSIKKVVLSKNLKTIGSSAFKKSKIKKIVFGKKLKEIGFNAFWQSEIEEVVFNKNVKILDNAFGRSKLQKVTLNGKAEFTRGSTPFYGCEHVDFYVKNRSIAKQLKNFLETCLKRNDIEHFNIYIKNALYFSMETKLEKLVVDNVKKIRTNEYSSSDIKEVVIGGKVRTIGVRAFSESDVEKATIGKKVKRIDIGAFEGSKLKEIKINGKTEIGSGAFNASLIEKVTLNAKIKIDKTSSPFDSSFGLCKNVKFYAKNKAIAKSLYSQLKGKDYFNNIVSCKIYVGNDLIYNMKKK